PATGLPLLPGVPSHDAACRGPAGAASPGSPASMVVRPWTVEPQPVPVATTSTSAVSREGRRSGPRRVVGGRFITLLDIDYIDLRIGAMGASRATGEAERADAQDRRRARATPPQGAIVSAALAFIDAHGLDAFSLKALAAELGMHQPNM